MGFLVWKWKFGTKLVIGKYTYIYILQTIFSNLFSVFFLLILSFFEGKAIESVRAFFVHSESLNLESRLHWKRGCWYLRESKSSAVNWWETCVSFFNWLSGKRTRMWAVGKQIGFVLYSFSTIWRKKSIDDWMFLPCSFLFAERYLKVNRACGFKWQQQKIQYNLFCAYFVAL